MEKMEAVLLAAGSQCNLFGNFGWSIQALLGFMCFSALILKRYLEKPRRRWKIWFMDTSKQGISACLLHMINLGASYVIDHYEVHANQCVWYFVNFTLDCVLGMALCYLLIKILQRVFERSRLLSFKSGFYGLPPRWLSWLYQVYLWLIICLTSKGIILLTVWIFHTELEYIGEVILTPLDGNPRLELLAVVIIIPIIMNTVIFWVTDSFIKSGKKRNTEGPDLEMKVNDLSEKLTLE